MPVALSIRFWTLVNPLLLRSLGATTGRNARIPGKLHLSLWGGVIIIGDNLYYSSGNGVNPLCANDRGALHVERGGRLTIGDNVGMSSTRIWVSKEVSIGSHVNIGGGVVITDTDAHPIDWRQRRKGGEGTLAAPVRIADDVWIGANTTILKGVTIGARSVVGAGSVVTRPIPPDCIAAGNPCRVIRKLSAQSPEE